MANNPQMLANLDPNYDPAYAAALERQQKMSDILMQQSTDPLQGQMVSNHYVAPSWTQGLAKMVQSYYGNKMGIEAASKLATMQASAYRNVLAGVTRSGASSAAPGANTTALAAGSSGQNPIPNAPPAMSDGSAAPASMIPASVGNTTGPTNANLALSKLLQAGSPATTNEAGPVPAVPSMPAQDTQMRRPGLFGNIPAPLVSASMSGLFPESVMSAAMSPYQATDATKMAIAANVDPTQANAGALAKNNYIAPNILRQGNTVLDPITHQPIFTSPDMDSGAGITWNKGQPSAYQIPGMTAIQGDLSQAKARGAANLKNEKVFNPATGQYEFRTSSQIADAATGFPRVSAADQTSRNTDRLGILQDALKNASNPAEIEQLKRMIGDTQSANNSGNPFSATTQSPLQTGLPKPFAAEPGLGIEKGAGDQQSMLTKSWGDLSEQNRQAQVTSSYLHNIAEQSQKAVTGPFSDKLNLVNGLLSLGGNEKATDEISARALLDKYSNQIVARLGSGSLGTDSARTILQSAYPNSHMPAGAIPEAVANLVGANDMIKAKTQFLSSHALSRDAVNYQKNELSFDANADPRIWQMKNITDPAARAAFAKRTMAQDPTFLDHIKALEGIKAL